MKTKHLIIVMLLISSVFFNCSNPAPSYDDYTRIDTSYPTQSEMINGESIIIERGKNLYVLTPKAEYKVGAIVARKKRYYDTMSPISPYDLALVWGIMAYPDNFKQVSIRQSKRRYWFFPKRNASLSTDWIYLNSSNHHIIPANDNIRKALKKVSRKDTVELEGYLVNVRATINGRTGNWNTSLSRDDRGDGACEIIYVTRLKRKYKVYE